MSPLSEREIEILRLTANDMTDKEIASSLEISFAGVRFYWRSIFKKLRCNTRACAVARAYQSWHLVSGKNAG